MMGSTCNLMWHCQVMSRSRLQKFVADICSEIRDLSPEVELNISYEPFEDVDATIRVYPPTEEAGELIDETIHRRTFDILLDEGYHISVLVFDPDSAQRPSKLEVIA